MINNVEAKFFELSELLYNNDPAGTCCAENKVTDEYDKESFTILQLNEFTQESVHSVFSEMFDGYYDKEVIDKIFPTIKRIVLS